MTSPNVLLLTVDTLRADMVGVDKNGNSITPYIDQLASNGVRFDQTMTCGSWTQAAFPTILTSTYASMFGGCLGPLAPERPSPVAALAEYGYATAGFTTSPLLSSMYGYDRGFDTFRELSPGEKDPFLRRITGGQKLLRKPLTHRIGQLLGIQTRPADLYVSGKVVSEAVCDWLASVEGPFFAWAHYMDVHWPYHRADRLDSPQLIAQMWKDLGHMHGVNWKGLPITAEQRAYYRRLYREAVKDVDRQLGLLLDFLAETGRLANTIIFLVSDHGEEFFERRHWGHFESNLYDEVMHVPLSIGGADVPRGRVVAQQVSTLDLMPTVLDICGCPPLVGMEGQSLVPLWRADGGDYNSEFVIGEMWRDHRHIIAVRSSAFKYIWDSQRPESPELYDLRKDPDERVNLYQDCPDVARDFQKIVNNHLRRLAAQQMVDVPQPERDPELVRRLRDLGYIE